MTHAVPIVADAWKNDQTVSPANANTAYGTPAVCTFAMPLNPTVNPTRSASGWNTSQSGPSRDWLYLTLGSRAARTRMIWWSSRLGRPLTPDGQAGSSAWAGRQRHALPRSSRRQEEARP